MPERLRGGIHRLGRNVVNTSYKGEWTLLGRWQYLYILAPNLVAGGILRLVVFFIWRTLRT
jgi:hypothetical protein